MMPNFLLRAWAEDPLMSVSLMVPKKPQLDQTVQSSTSHVPTPSHPSLENIKKPSVASQVFSIPASRLEQELSDSDLPSSVVDEIEVHSSFFSQLVHEICYI